MIIEKLIELPGYIQHEDCIFKLEITRKKDGINICYIIENILPKSKHYQFYSEWGSWINPFNGNTQGFLWLYEQAETDEEFIEAINECLTFLKTNNLYETTK